MTGNLTVGSASLQTNGYVTGTWLKTTANTSLGSAASKIAVINDGLVYSRTTEQIKSDIGLGNVDNVKQYSASNPPPYPVTSVNGATGEVKSTFYVTVTKGNDGTTADKTAEEIYAAYMAGYAVYANVKFGNDNNPVSLPLMLALNDPNSMDGGLSFIFGAMGSYDPKSRPEYMSVLCYGNLWGAWVGELARSEDIPEIPLYLPNPKALYIKSGKTTTRYDGSAIETVEIPEGVPSVTTADNGKFLRVVSGAWAAVEIANANGGSF